MASSIQLLRSSNAKERPSPGNLLEGQPAININPIEPGLFFKLSNGEIVKIGPAAITTNGNPPNSGGAGQSGNCVGELWLDKSVTPPVLKIFDGAAWIDAGSGGTGGVTSVNGLDGDVVLTAGSLDAYTKGEVDTLFSTNLVNSVNGESGIVILTAGDVGAYTTSETEALVSRAGESAGFANIYSVNTDRINSERDAAQFLRQTTLGPTKSEIEELVALGSKGAWLVDQMASSFDNSRYSEWAVIEDPDSTDPGIQRIYRKPATGWFGGVGHHLKYNNTYPDPFQSSATVSPSYTGVMLSERMLQTAFIRNNPGKGGIGSVRVPGPGPIGADNGSGTINTFSVNTPVINNTETGGVDVTPNDRRDPRKSLLCKVTWILGKVFPASIPGNGFPSQADGIALQGWYSGLSRFAFTTWAELLEEVTYSVAMSAHLTYLRNQKDNGSGRQPDENYAREIQQLFSIGLYRRNLDGSYVLDDNELPILNYTNADIVQLSKAFTGLTRWDRPDEEYYDSAENIQNTMLGGGLWLAEQVHIGWLNGSTILGTEKPAKVIKAGERYQITSVGSTNWSLFGASAATVGTMFVATSDGTVNSGDGLVKEVRERERGCIPRLKHYIPWYETGAKQLLEKDGQPGQYHIDIPIGTDPETNIRMAIEGLVNHPSCAPNVALQLIKFSTTSNPSPSYVSRVASVFRDNGQGIVGHLPSVWAAIFTDPEASQDLNSSVRKGRIRDGFENLCNLIRSTDGQTNHSYYNPVTDPNNAGRNIFVDGEIATEMTYGVVEWAYFGGGNQKVGAWPGWSPSIFGFYSQEYTVSPALEWGLTVPELGSLPPSTLFTAIDFFQVYAARYNWNDYAAGNGVTMPDEKPLMIDYTLAFPKYAGTLDVKDLIDEIDLMLCGGSMNARKKSELTTSISTMPGTTRAEITNVISMALQLVIYCPEFWIA